MAVQDWGTALNLLTTWLHSQDVGSGPATPDTIYRAISEVGRLNYEGHTCLDVVSRMNGDIVIYTDRGKFRIE